jgi:hypothetical protein
MKTYNLDNEENISYLNDHMQKIFILIENGKLDELSLTVSKASIKSFDSIIDQFNLSQNSDELLNLNNLAKEITPLSTDTFKYVKDGTFIQSAVINAYGHDSNEDKITIEVSKPFEFFKNFLHLHFEGQTN